ncbi:MAG: glutamate 5-kinase [Bacteroidetes bacterium]|nr:glutamate 5-kinase [Bacteroidota bacterium]
MNRPLVIIKLGTSSVIKSDGSVDKQLLDNVARQCKVLSADYRLLLVSSGAVGVGRPLMSKYKGRIEDRKAAAAIGNPILMGHYSVAFARQGMQIAQTLCERSHFSNRENFLQLRNTIETLWKNDILPISNENDVVSDLELKFSDNDELATLMAVGLGAGSLLLGTSVDGVLNRNGGLINEINHFSEDIMGLATRERSEFGLGGMVSKLTFARLATRLGIRVIIFGSHLPDGILKAMDGKAGTLCKPKPSSPDARKKWLASGSIVSGRMIIDHGAGKALNNRKSLLSVGVVSVEGPFERGEVVEIFVEGNNWPLCVARAKLSSDQLQAKLGEANTEVAHADDIVLL